MKKSVKMAKKCHKILRFVHNLGNLSSIPVGKYTAHNILASAEELLVFGTAEV